MAFAVALRVAFAATLLATSIGQADAANAPYTAIAQSWAQAWSHQLADATARLYAPDAVFIHASGQRVQGRAAIDALLRHVLAKNIPHITMKSVATARAGSVAWDSGTYHETIAPVGGGPTRSLSGSYLLVLEQDQTGEWLIERQMWSETEGQN